MIKNPTPVQVCILIALSCALIVVLFLELLVAFGVAVISHLVIFGIAVVVFGAAYMVGIRILKRYVFQRIRLIFKNIYKTKDYPYKNAKNINLKNDLLDNVEREVQTWAEIKENEVESLKALENYRRNFIGDVSHELKTPLFNIQGYIYTLLEGGLYDESINKQYLLKAAKNIDRLNQIIEGLDAISFLESNQQALDTEAFDIKNLSEAIIEELDYQAKKRDIKLEFKKNAAQSFDVNANREGIRQVLTNLVVNGIKYGEKGGHVRIGFYDMDELVLVEVADNGVGIGDEHLQQIFSRFYRVDKSRSRKKGGSGLGLAIAKHIVEAHKQTINVRSTEGQGSTFSFTLEKARFN